MNPINGLNIQIIEQCKNNRKAENHRVEAPVKFAIKTLINSKLWKCSNFPLPQTCPRQLRNDPHECKNWITTAKTFSSSWLCNVYCFVVYSLSHLFFLGEGECLSGVNEAGVAVHRNKDTNRKWNEIVVLVTIFIFETYKFSSFCTILTYLFLNETFFGNLSFVKRGKVVSGSI